MSTYKIELSKDHHEAKRQYPKTYGDALAAGWVEADSKWERGYVSRKADEKRCPVQIAGGHRLGDAYVLLPSFRSTQYCVRQYLRA
jgi:hypothetical protein